MNFLSMNAEERVTSVLAVRKEDWDGDWSLMMVTKNGIAKKSDAAAFKDVRRSGLIAITLKDDDSQQRKCKHIRKSLAAAHTALQRSWAMRIRYCSSTSAPDITSRSTQPTKRVYCRPNNYAQRCLRRQYLPTSLSRYSSFTAAAETWKTRSSSSTR